MQFSYLIEKILSAEIKQEPFRHIWINDFFSASDFAQISQSVEVNLPAQSSDEALFGELFQRGYKIIDFPGCITDRHEYIKWHKHKQANPAFHGSSCEGFGVTLRLMKPQSHAIAELMAFLKSPQFLGAMAEKFGVDFQETTHDVGLQKYLDGYEISPHPDIRKKALTFMVNINPNPDSERCDHHTHYLSFVDRYRYVQSYWEGNPKMDRCWVPWDWCETKSVQSQNNSIVIFSPGNDSVHAVRANYDHLAFQRTQLYGNLWHRASQVTGEPKWENLVIHPYTAPPPPAPVQPSRSLLNRLRGQFKRQRQRQPVQPVVQEDEHVIKDRLRIDQG